MVDEGSFLKRARLGQHRMLELLNSVQFELDMLKLNAQGNREDLYQKTMTTAESNIQRLKSIIWLHFDVLDNMRELTREIYPNSDGIYETIMNAINTLSSIIDQKDIKIGFSGIRDARFDHNSKIMTETLTHLMSVMIENAKAESEVIIATHNEDGKQVLNLCCSDSMICAADWSVIIDFAAGKTETISSRFDLWCKEETILAIILVQLLLIRQNMRMDTFATENDVCVFRIMHEDTDNAYCPND